MLKAPMWKVAKPTMWTVAVVLAVSLILLLILATFVDHQQVQAALDWLQTLIGLFVILTGVGSSAAPLFQDDKAHVDTHRLLLGIGPGVVAVLAGSIMLGAGEWAAPIGLGVGGLGVGLALALRPR